MWFFESFCGTWTSRPRPACQVGAASFKINGLEPQAALGPDGSTRILEEPLRFSRFFDDF